MTIEERINKKLEIPVITWFGCNGNFCQSRMVEEIAKSNENIIIKDKAAGNGSPETAAFLDAEKV